MVGSPAVSSARARAHAALRRPVEVAVVALALLIGAATVLTRDVEYASTSSVLFVDSPTVEQYAVATQLDVDPTSESPLARFHDPTVVADVFVRLYRSREKLRELADEGMAGRLIITTRRTVVSATPDHGPVFEMTVVAASPDLARASSHVVLEDLLDELDRQQAGYEPELSVRAAPIAEPNLGRPVGGSRVRSTVGFTLLAVLLGVAVRQTRLWLRRWMGMRAFA
ncbi:MAG: hypothetical protein H6513_15890 [Acidimicrobiaceae bacterium]|nr:hypothetical protein [Ilumatobacter sp.]MCB0981287.1 hypothetical protein [Ilumatobacter sp.]MCB9382166.1 hypothetical protein [Acidimicrobiaceae bacterium]MCO5330920.1 hypothetical protein [Ilumatobacteraceae bacterium]